MTHDCCETQCRRVPDDRRGAGRARLESEGRDRLALELRSGANHTVAVIT
jgi:hypothetical protein